jgi:hypothetical protein
MPAKRQTEDAKRNEAAQPRDRAAPLEVAPLAKEKKAAIEPQRAEPKPFAEAPPAAAPEPPPQAKALADARRDAERSEMRQAPAPPSVAAARPAAPPVALEAQRAKREERLAGGRAKEGDPDPRVKELERIAQLRRDGRHPEADEALQKFRRENPDYRIPEALWERVRPR